jgi:ABC-type amino acid transport substrate-binding protein
MHNKLIIFVLALLFIQSSFAEKITVACFHYPPFFISPQVDKSNEGIIIELLRKTFRKSGHELDIKWMNLARAIKTVHEGKTDSICALNDRFLGKLDFVKPKLVDAKVAVWTRKSENYVFTGVDSLGDQKVGNIQGFVYKDSSPDYEEYLSKKRGAILTISGQDSVARMFKLMEKKRVDIFSINPEYVYYLLGKPYIRDHFKVAGYLKNRLVGFFGISPLSKKKKLIKEAYQLEIHHLLRSKEYQQVLKKYKQVE